MCQSRTVGTGSGFLCGLGRVGLWALILGAASLVATALAPAAHAQAPPPPTAAAPPPPGATPAATPPSPPGTNGTAPPTPAAVPPAPTTSSGGPQYGDLTTRFKFIERYAVDTGKAMPNDIKLYRVGAIGTHRTVVEREQGSPERSEASVQIIYTERPAVVNVSGVVTDAVRRYEKFLSKAPQGAQELKLKPLDGLTVWYKSRAPLYPMVFSLTEGRTLSEHDYTATAHSIFTPTLTSILPTSPVRVGDRWQLSREAVRVLFGYTPTKTQPVYATFQTVRKNPKGPGFHAVIGISGHAKLPPNDADYTLLAEALFGFQPTSATAAGQEIVEAAGGITSLRLTKSNTSAVAGSKGRLRNTHTNDLRIERQLVPAGIAPLAGPATPPAPTEANSWLTFEDPSGRFHFRHPQDYLYRPELSSPEEDLVVLGDGTQGQPPMTILRFEVIPKTGNAESDRATRDPEFYLKRLKEEWGEDRTDVLRGPFGWLPDADWSPTKMKVYWIDAALKPAGQTGRGISRFFFDRYIVLFTRDECVVVTATTPKDPPTPFRKEVEAAIKTFSFDGPVPPKPAAATP